ncbi:MAG: endonuclease domain-containing protein [Acidiferrobacterales bacterium]
MQYTDYLAKHGQSEKCVCPCGQEFENTRYPGGPRSHGRRQIYCSAKCTGRATNVRYYGLTLEDYYRMLREQDHRCAICGNEEVKQLAVDHEHVEGWAQMLPEERKKYVRGLLCILCNKHRMAGVDLAMALRMVAFLQRSSS